MRAGVGALLWGWVAATWLGLGLGAALPSAEEVFGGFSDVVRLGLGQWGRGGAELRGEGLGALGLGNASVVVGGRERVLRLRASDLRKLEELRWRATPEATKYCRMSGQPSEDCQNFVRTVAVGRERTLLCGTGAFAPVCQWRDSARLSRLLSGGVDGVGLVPYSPHSPHAFALTEAGDFFSAVPTDFSGHDASLLRVWPKERLLRSAKSGWFDQPAFLAMVPADGFLLFFFRERRAERQGDGWAGRVGRVCANDQGGNELLSGVWTTFNKATLECGGEGRLGSLAWDPASGLAAAAFTSNYSSSVCLYDRAALHAPFAGPFLHQASPESLWQPRPNSQRFFHCEVNGPFSKNPGLTTRPLQEAQSYQLMASAAKPLDGGPVHVAQLERYDRLLLDTVLLKHHGPVQVLFAVTSAGLLKKFSLLPQSLVAGKGKETSDTKRVACLVEVIQLWNFNESRQVSDAKLLQDAVLISTSAGILRLPKERCERWKSRERCLGAADPYCGWAAKEAKCVSTIDRPLESVDQDVASCPDTDVPVDGGWGEWAAWAPCSECQCRRRTCDAPTPQRGGAECVGEALEVSNCSRDGGWTVWSTWSACSASCGVAVKTRSRSCSNPSPAFGGRLCLGPESEQEYCAGSPECPLPTPAPVHGGWSLWSAWDRCSRKCGGGLRKRRRSCSSPRPRHSGRQCAGCDAEYEECGAEPCPVVRRWSEWTDWLQANATASLGSRSSGVWVKRFKFACSVRTEEASLLDVSRPRSDEKFCQKDTDDCTETGFRSVDGGWSGWSVWGECSAKCGGGQRWRRRSCSEPAPVGSGLSCAGHGAEAEECGTWACEAEWSCWSGWAECSATCGPGVRERSRGCDGGRAGQTTCRGPRVESLPCQLGPCSSDGYGEWTAWSACSQLEVSVRVRPCTSEAYCRGLPDAQLRECEGEGEAPAFASAQASSVVPAAVAAVVAFAAGVGASLCLVCLALRRRSNCLGGWAPKLRAPSAPATASSSAASQRSELSVKTPASLNLYSPSPETPHSPQSLLPSHPLLLPGQPLPSPHDPPLPSPTDHHDLYGDMDGNLTLKRSMRASLKDRDYL